MTPLLLMSLASLLWIQYVNTARPRLTRSSSAPAELIGAGAEAQEARRAGLELDERFVERHELATDELGLRRAGRRRRAPRRASPR